jgi:hypothetical protein
MTERQGPAPRRASLFIGTDGAGSMRRGASSDGKPAKIRVVAKPWRPCSRMTSWIYDRHASLLKRYL